jgi:hypothetical protein
MANGAQDCHSCGALRSPIEQRRLADSRLSMQNDRSAFSSSDQSQEPAEIGLFSFPPKDHLGKCRCGPEVCPMRFNPQPGAHELADPTIKGDN